MRCFIGIVIAALQLIGVRASVDTYETECCYTQIAKTSVKHVPTSTTTVSHHSTRTRTVVSTPTQTVTLKGATIVTTSTSTVDETVTSTPATETDTFTSTLTDTTTTTETDPAVTYSTTTTTTLTITSIISTTTTIATVPGFTPIISEPAVTAGGGGTDLERRRKRHNDAAGDSELKARGQYPYENDCSSSGRREGRCFPKVYPQEVDCTKTVEVIDYTTKTITGRARTVTTTNPATTTTKTVLTTSTSTVVVPPPEVSTTVFVTNTITDTVTETPTTTLTETDTITTTTFAAEATEYAQCSSDNFLTDVGGNAIASYSDSLLSFGQSADAVSCCISCAVASNCAGFSFYSTYCTLFESFGLCDGSRSQGSFSTEPGERVSVVLGNGGCGQMSFNGVI